MNKCVMCGKETDELCPDEVCRECHKSLSFEDCCDGTWSARLELKAGVPLDIVKTMHPEAKIDDE